MKAKDLKNSILQMAVQGKLVEQDPTDEPASVLLEHIRAERAKLIREKKIKAPKGGESVIYRASDGKHYEKRVDAKGRESEPVCIDGEIPFEIPESWEWVRMGSVLTFLNGRAYKKTELLDKGRTPVLRVGNLFTNSSWYYSDLDLSSDKYCEKGDLLYAWSASFGPTIWDGGRCIFHYHIWNVKHSSLLNRGYLYWFLLEDVNRIRQFTTGSTMIHVSMEHMIPRLMPIPPQYEQARIAERLEMISPYIDAYDALETARETLDAELPNRLRKSILQLAVQGKLVSQDPNDEPASVLLDCIRQERAQLIKNKKIKAPKGGESIIYRASDGGYYEKRGKSDPVCIDNVIPFEIPDSWAWARLESVTIYIQRGKSPKYSPIKKYPIVSQKCNQWSGFSLEPAKFIDPNTVDSYAEERILQDGDLLWNSTGLGTLGRMAIYDSSVNEYGWAVSDSHVTVIRTLQNWLDNRYAFVYFAGPSVQSVIEDQASGSTKQKELTQDTVRSYLIPIPPRSEQSRIAVELGKILPHITNQ